MMGGGGTGVRCCLLSFALVALLAACSSGSGRPGALVAGSATPSATATASPAPAASASAPPLEPVQRAGVLDFGYFTAITRDLDPVRLSFDRALYYQGALAEKVAAAHGVTAPLSGDYYILNEFPKLYTVVVDPHVAVFGSLKLNAFASGGFSVVKQPQTLDTFLDFLATSAGPTTPWRIEYGKGGRIVKITEQYVP